MNKKAALQIQPVTISFDPKEALTEGKSNRKNLGYATLSKLCHELGLGTSSETTTDRLNLDSIPITL